MSLIEPHKKKSAGVKSGDRDGQSIDPCRPIHRSGNFHLRSRERGEHNGLELLLALRRCSRFILDAMVGIFSSLSFFQIAVCSDGVTEERSDDTAGPNSSPHTNARGIQLLCDHDMRILNGKRNVIMPINMPILFENGFISPNNSVRQRRICSDQVQAQAAKTIPANQP